MVSGGGILLKVAELLQKKPIVLLLPCVPGPCKKVRPQTESSSQVPPSFVAGRLDAGAAAFDDVSYVDEASLLASFVAADVVPCALLLWKLDAVKCSNQLLDDAGKLSRFLHTGLDAAWLVVALLQWNVQYWIGVRLRVTASFPRSDADDGSNDEVVLCRMPVVATADENSTGGGAFVVVAELFRVELELELDISVSTCLRCSEMLAVDVKLPVVVEGMMPVQQRQHEADLVVFVVAAVGLFVPGVR